MITSNSYPQCLHLNSASQILILATLWAQFGQDSQVFLFELPESTEDPVSMLRTEGSIRLPPGDRRREIRACWTTEEPLLRISAKVK